MKRFKENKQIQKEAKSYETIEKIMKVEDRKVWKCYEHCSIVAKIQLLKQDRKTMEAIYFFLSTCAWSLIIFE